MISLSNLIKSSNYVSLDNRKLIEVLQDTFAKAAEETHTVETAADTSLDENGADVQKQIEQLEAMKEQMMKDAQLAAEEYLRKAGEEAEAMRAAARREIEEWWELRRKDDEQVLEQARVQGREEGFQEGIAAAEAKVNEEWNQTLDEAKGILEQAYRHKEQIIAEAEPFLIELSSAIAQKIIGKQLTISQEWMIDMVKNVLIRRRDKGVIVLCVNPSQFDYIQDARDELALALDSQAELQILPDRTVQEFGCVVRTPFGSIDARIDTQLTEIKSALHQLARGDSTEPNDVGTQE